MLNVFFLIMLHMGNPGVQQAAVGIFSSAADCDQARMEVLAMPETQSIIKADKTVGLVCAQAINPYASATKSAS